MKKMIACDLDQTLIYSARFLAELSLGERDRVSLVESKDGEEISYMSIRSIERLRELSKQNLFVPSTTRTMEQYNRVSIFSKDLKPKYAVTSNGGNVLVNGEPDRDWNSHIFKNIKELCEKEENVLSKFAEIQNIEWSSEKRAADGLFYYFIINKDFFPYEKMNNFESWMESSGWQLSIQGRKMYFIPKILDKWEGIKYIAEKENCNFIFAAGDSKLDWKMLHNANTGVCPLHGTELINHYNTREKSKEIVFTETKGIFASEEILDKFELE